MRLFPVHAAMRGAAPSRGDRRPSSGRHTPGPRRPLGGRSAVVAIDAEGAVLRADPHLCRCAGYAPDVLVGSFLFSFMHARDLEPILRDVAALVNHRKEAARWTFRFRAADGSWLRLFARVDNQLRLEPGEILLTLTDSPRSGAP